MKENKIRRDREKKGITETDVLFFFLFCFVKYNLKCWSENQQNNVNRRRVLS